MRVTLLRVILAAALAAFSFHALAQQGLIATDRLLGRDTTGTGQVEQITVGGGIEFTGSKGITLNNDTIFNEDFGDFTCSAGVCTVDANAIALGTDTTGNYVAEVADGTGIDGTCASEGCTFTPTFDATELSTLTWGSGSGFAWTFDAGATDPVITFGSNSIAITSAATFTHAGNTIWTAGNDGSGSGLDADLLDGNNVGTSGTAVPLLSGANTWGAGQIISASNPFFGFIDSDTGADGFFGGNFTNGSFGIWADYNNEVASSTICLSIDSSSDCANYVFTPTVLRPAANDGAALGASSLAWADLWLAAGGLIEFNGATDSTFTCASGNCTIEGNGVYRAGGTDVALADGGTGASLSDPGADRIMWWDESDNAIELTSLSALTTEAAPSSGDFLVMVDASGALLKVDWASLPGSGGGISNVAEDTSPTLGGNLEGGGFSLGTSGSQASDVFLEEGGVINWDAGDATITQTGNDITVAGISTFGVGTSTVVTLGSMEIGHATQNTFACSSGNCTIEGNGIYRAGGTDVAIADGGTGASDAATAFASLKQAATTSASGVSELATQTETEFKTSTTLVPTPSAFKNYDRGAIWGLTLSNSGADATNDFGVAVGVAASSVTPYPLMENGSALIKQTDAAWADGTNAGCLDGTEGGADNNADVSTWQHIYLIYRSDTGDSDIACSENASAPERDGTPIPAAYDHYRRIGSIFNDSGGTLRQFNQVGDNFLYESQITEISVTNTGRAAALLTLSVPTGIQVRPIGFVTGALASSGTVHGYVSDVETPNGVVGGPQMLMNWNGQQEIRDTVEYSIHTNTSAQVYFTVTEVVSAATYNLNLVTEGYVDTRGRLF